MTKPLPFSAIRVREHSRHRNGIGGAPFDVVLFDDDEGRKLAVLFEAPWHCAVFDMGMLAGGDIAFGSNSWRGDVFEPALRQHLKTIR